MVGLCLHPSFYFRNKGGSRVVSEDPTKLQSNCWFPAYSPHVFKIVTNYFNPVLKPVTKSKHFIFEGFHAYSELIINIITYINGIPLLNKTF